MYYPEQLAEIIELRCKSLPIAQQPHGLFDPVRYIMEDGGKRMRPILALMAANVFNDSIDGSIGSAIAIEIFHNFTLLHDDIMDKAPLRRGRATVHVRWDENTAILSGDAMIPIAYEVLCGGVALEMLPQLMSDFNKVTMEVFVGQQYDMEFEKRTDVALYEYEDMIRLKTAVLPAAGMKMAAMIAGASEEQQSAIYDFGINLGMAFQIQDDLLDTYGDSRTFGKTIGGDIAVGKQTFLMISAKERATEDQMVILHESRDYDQVKCIYDSIGVKHVAKRAIESYYAKALESLERCCEDKSRLQPLKDYASVLLKRNK